MKEIYTWVQGGFKERLDQNVCNVEWNDMHLLSVLHNLEYANSDHQPILLDTEHLRGVTAKQPVGSHGFEERCLHE